MSASTHPFTMPYVGLGLLDEASIRRDGETWSADYPIGDEPYLTIRVARDRVEIHESEGATVVARTHERTLVGAIGLHGRRVLDGEVSSFWRRLAERAGSVWVGLTAPKLQFTFVPAIGFGRLSVPSPLGGPWVTPEPGPLARRFGFRPFDRADPGTTVSALLYRFVDDEPEPRVEDVRLHGTDLPGILVAETVAAFYAANGPLRSVEWRPFVDPAPAGPLAQRWYSAPSRLPDGGLLTGFALVEANEVGGRGRMACLG